MNTLFLCSSFYLIKKHLENKALQEKNPDENVEQYFFEEIYHSDFHTQWAVM